MAREIPSRALHSEPGLNVRLCWYGSGYDMSEHRHDVSQLSILIAGKFSEVSDGRSVHNSPAMMGFKPAGLSHANSYGAGGALILSINANPEHLVGAGQWNWAAIGPNQDRLSRSLLASDTGEVRTRDLAFDLLEYASDEFRVESSAPAWAKRLREQIQEEPDVNFERVAQQEGLHRAHISRGFRKWFGVSPSLFAQRCRLGRALQLMADGVAKADAAIEAGFSDQSHLTRIMKRESGLTPGAFCDLVCA